MLGAAAILPSLVLARRRLILSRAMLPLPGAPLHHHIAIAVHSRWLVAPRVLPTATACCWQGGRAVLPPPGTPLNHQVAIAIPVQGWGLATTLLPSAVAVCWQRFQCWWQGKVEVEPNCYILTGATSRLCVRYCLAASPLLASSCRHLLSGSSGA